MSTHQPPNLQRTPSDSLYTQPKSSEPFDPYAPNNNNNNTIQRSNSFVGGEYDEPGRYRDDPSNPSSNEALTGSSPTEVGYHHPPDGMYEYNVLNDAGAGKMGGGGYHYEKRGKHVGFAAPPPQTLRQYRREQHADLWTRGGPLRTCCRFLFCTLFTAIFFFLSIVGALALWARPPSVDFGTPGLSSSSSITINTSTIAVPLELNISVNNPNYFSIDLSQLSVNLTYPTNSTPVGSGSLSSVSIHSHAQTNFTFPFSISISYSSSSDTSTDLDILLDIAEKCGFLGSGSTSQLSFDAEIKVEVQVLSVKVPVNVPYTVSVDCPFDESEFESILQEIESGLSRRRSRRWPWDGTANSRLLERDI